MLGLGPEVCREPVQQGRDVVGVQCMKFAVVQLEPVGWRRAGGSKQVSREAGHHSGGTETDKSRG